MRGLARFTMTFPRFAAAIAMLSAPDMEGYNEMYLMIDTRFAQDGDIAWVDNVHVYRISRRD